MRRISLKIGIGVFSWLVLSRGVLAEENDPLSIPDSDEGVPGAGPLRRTDWFRGVWKGRRSSWLNKTEKPQDSIVFLGDSITQGWGDDFRGFFGDLNVVNRGISGDTSRGLLLRLPGDVLDLNPKAVVIMVGANDLAEKARGETVFNNVKLIVTRLKKHSETMRIIVCETFPCAPDDYRPVAEIQKINALYAKTWANDARVTVASTYKLFAGSDGASLPKLLPDRVHPNISGYAVWAGAMHKIFRNLKLGDGAAYPHAWVHFSRNDREAVLFNGLYGYSMNRPAPLQLTMNVEPEPGHHLAFQWVTKDGLVSPIKIEVNGNALTRRPSSGDEKSPPLFWESIPVSEFGISKREHKGSYRIRISQPEGDRKDAFISGVRLISSPSQLKTLQLPEMTHEATFDFPGTKSESEKSSR
ncbi:MAG: GDSL-type esterase/lipase family protein [Roseibacillus sp.]|nr:GDSL-type esterase/lipase family protein [Roseibacillus sp.]